MLVDLGEDRFFVERYGAGPPLVTLHGGLGLDHSYLRPWLDPLGESFEVIYFDQRGCGRSRSSLPLDRVTHEKWAEDVDRLRVTLGLERITLLGHSYGAFIALEFALRYQASLSGLVLGEVAPVIDYPEAIMQNARERAPSAAVFERVASSFGRPVETDAQLEQVWKDILPVYFFRYDAAIAERMNAHMIFRAEAFNQSAGTCLRTFNVLPRLAEIEVPTAVLAGRYDWLTPVEQGAERVHAGIRGSELTVFEQSGHFPFVEEQQAFLSSVREFQRRRLK